jgi:hypothetical protein
MAAIGEKNSKMRESIPERTIIGKNEEMTISVYVKEEDYTW